jgi:hypothetical protein
MRELYFEEFISFAALFFIYEHLTPLYVYLFSVTGLFTSRGSPVNACSQAIGSTLCSLYSIQCDQIW